jgi:hypothetical protein
MYDLAFAKGGETTRPSIEIYTRPEYLDLANQDPRLPEALHVYTYAGKWAVTRYMGESDAYGYGGVARLSNRGNGEVCLSLPVPSGLDEYALGRNQTERVATIHFITGILNAIHRGNPDRYPKPLVSLSTEINPAGTRDYSHMIRATIAEEVAGMIDLLSDEQKRELEEEIKAAIASYGDIAIDNDSIIACVENSARIYMGCPGDGCGLDSFYDGVRKEVRFAGKNNDTAREQLMLLGGLAVILPYLNKS